MGYVYILKSLKNGRYYIGSSQDPDERLAFHNFGKVKSTQHLIPWKRVYLKRYNTITEAIKEEYRIKSMKSRRYIDHLISERPDKIGEAHGSTPLAPTKQKNPHLCGVSLTLPLLEGEVKKGYYQLNCDRKLISPIGER